MKKLTGTGRGELIAIIEGLETRIDEFEHCWYLKGWFCAHCEGFNGEEKEATNNCRYCLKVKLRRKMRK